MKLLTIRSVALTTTFFTGLSALVYEVTWHYFLANLLGSQARSTAIILATFLGSLALGYQLFGLLSRQLRSFNLVRICGALEIFIGVWALLFGWIYSGLWQVRLILQSDSSSLLSDLLFSAILVSPPAAAMGATLPLLTQGLSRDLSDAPKFHTHIYAVNTLGAFLGSLLAAFILIPSLGLSGAMTGGAIINIVAGSLLYLMAGRIPQEVGNSPGEKDEDILDLDVQSPQLLAAPKAALKESLYPQIIAALAGFTAITLQSLMIRVTALSVGSSTYAFSLVVAVCIALLAVGAWLFADRYSRHVSLFGAHVLAMLGLVGLFLIIPRLPYYTHVLRTLFTSQTPNFWIYHSVIFMGLCLLLALPIGANGAILPLLFRDARQTQRTLGATVGKIYSRNALGCVLGAVIGGYLSLFALDLPGVFRSVIVSTAIGATLAAGIGHGGISLLKVLIPAGIIAIAFVSPGWPPAMMGSGTFRNITADDHTYAGYESFFQRNRAYTPVLGYDDDPNSTILVSGRLQGQKSIVVNGKSDGSTRGGDRATTLLVGNIPGFLQRSASDEAVVIGFGTGITTGALTRHDEFKQVRVLEISPAVKSFAPLFDSENGNASTNPKVTWHLGDAYRYLLTSRSLYGVIVSEPSNPWVGGVERLYSQEFYKVARTKLAPHGLFAQWFHIYSISQETLAMVLKTFSSVFPNVYLFENGMDLVLLGSEIPLDRSNIETMQERMVRPVFKDDLKDMGVTSPKQLFAREHWMGERDYSDSQLHTLAHPRLSFAAGKDFFLNKKSDIRSLNQLPKYQFNARNGVYKTLTSAALQNPDREKFLESLINFHCNKTSPAFFDGWDKTTYECQVPLISSMIFGYNAPPSQGIPSDTIMALKNLSSASLENITPALNVEAASRTLQWAAQYGAPFLNFSAQSLLRYAEPCLIATDIKSLSCRGQLATSLLTNGHRDVAIDEHRRLMSEELLPPYSQLENEQRLIFNFLY